MFNKKLILIAFIPVVLIMFVFMIYFVCINRSSNINEEVYFEIPSGMGISSIADSLKSQDIIKNTLFFKVYIKINKLDSKIQAGNYIIPPNSNIKSLTNLFGHGRNDVAIKFLEGWRIEQLALLLSQELDNIEYKEFISAAQEYEGYLFPDTYYVNKDITQDRLIQILRDNFNQKTKDLLSKENIQKTGLSKEEIVILASIIEREAIKQEDREIISGILIKRINEGMRIEADATTQYAVALKNHCEDNFIGIELENCLEGKDEVYINNINWWPSTLTRDDLDYDSPYNTRKNPGFPPKPISSFSIASLESVVNYKKSNYYFYLTDSNGVTHFAENLDMHNQNIFNYLQ